MNINQGKQVGSRGSPCSGLHVAPALIRRPAGIVQYHATVFMYLLVCIRGNVYVRVETYTCVRVQAFASVYLCTCARARARVCVCVCVCVCACVHACVFMHDAHKRRAPVFQCFSAGLHQARLRVLHQPRLVCRQGPVVTTAYQQPDGVPSIPTAKTYSPSAQKFRLHRITGGGVHRATILNTDTYWTFLAQASIPPFEQVLL
jgi:hypothetical protein